MQYLGRISGSGMLTCNGEEIVRASYDIEGFFRKPKSVIGTGEVRFPAGTWNQLAGRKDVQLLTDDGRVLDLGFVKTPPHNDDTTYIDVTGGLPATPGLWRS
ncbi:hypothetical protein SAMN02745157_0126 [Kaistia soli DSM 19436]|uniref:Uncharacterized protein n=1 Tax=Kaistia soli DSM 19436 TaxID=1122133 RepID=A0A1M5PDA0_9HYPH|nr:hypothetical protein [Kaistia soli]SHG99459.1 hypothetical protein SAMN02745157_0126 [Kaistia soli DSM 19436]